jgi:YVTN family beta-propeller protein
MLKRIFAGVFVLFLLNGVAALRTSDPNNLTGTTGLIMIDKRGSFVRFFDPASLKEVGNLTIGGPPHELAISADHKTAFVPIYGDGVYGNNPHPGHVIAIIDLASRKMTGTIDVSPYQAPHGLQVDTAGMLYATCDLSRKFLVIDPKTKSIKAAIDTEGTGHWIAVLPDASKAYVANKNDRPFISVIDLKTRKMTGKVDMPKGTQGFATSPDGKRLLAANFADPEVVVIDTATDKVIDKIAIERSTRGPFRVKFSPDGTKLMTASDRDGLVNILNPANLHAKQQVIKVGASPFGIAFAPDGKTALVSNHGDGTISVIDLQAGKVANTFTAGTGIETLSYY